MKKNIIFVTTNRGKIREVKFILKDFPFFALNELTTLCPEPVESGVTFLENAQIKAGEYFTCLNRPVIADDSGLVVPALNDEPGVHSSRFAGPDATDLNNNLLLLHRMQTLKGSQRQAYFECVVVYKDHDLEKNFRGRCYGVIQENPKGNGGFGYDPLFYVGEFNKTFAELTIAEKNRVSHRARAFVKLKSFLIKRQSEY